MKKNNLPYILQIISFLSAFIIFPNDDLLSRILFGLAFALPVTLIVILFKKRLMVKKNILVVQYVLLIASLIDIFYMWAIFEAARSIGRWG